MLNQVTPGVLQESTFTVATPQVLEEMVRRATAAVSDTQELKRIQVEPYSGHPQDYGFLMVHDTEREGHRPVDSVFAQPQKRYVVILVPALGALAVKKEHRHFVEVTAQHLLSGSGLFEENGISRAADILTRLYAISSGLAK